MGLCIGVVVVCVGRWVSVGGTRVNLSIVVVYTVAGLLAKGSLGCGDYRSRAVIDEQQREA